MFPRAFRTRAQRTSWARLFTNKARPDILNCSGCSLYKFGDPTSEPSKALFRHLTWRIHDGTAASKASSAWAIYGPRAAQLVDAALLGKARADPPDSRTWPFLGIDTSVSDKILKVTFNTRLESNSYLATSGEFTDFTARYFGIRKDEEDALTLRGHLKKFSLGALADNKATDGSFLLDIVTALKLDTLLDIPLVGLSNGQTRRARIARALITRPEVLVLEEPFSTLRYLNPRRL